MRILIYGSLFSLSCCCDCQTCLSRCPYRQDEQKLPIAGTCTIHVDKRSLLEDIWNIQGIMPIDTSTDGSEDVNDFLLRIRDLSRRRDMEDEERTRKLEEEIIQGRKERQARRSGSQS